MMKPTNELHPIDAAEVISDSNGRGERRCFERQTEFMRYEK